VPEEKIVVYAIQYAPARAVGSSVVPIRRQDTPVYS
jgi:hypothetical protein